MPIILRNNRWRCDHGWDIDLDDGSSNYEIYNNLCLNGGLKNREGFYRVVENNITVNNSFHPHVWYGNSQDIFRRNIVFGTLPARARQSAVGQGDVISICCISSARRSSSPPRVLQEAKRARRTLHRGRRACSWMRRRAITA